MAIKRKEKRRLLQTAALLMRANEKVFMGFGQNTEEVMIDALSQSQETALLLGTELENVGKADLPVFVPLAVKIRLTSCKRATNTAAPNKRLHALLAAHKIPVCLQTATSDAVIH